MVCVNSSEYIIIRDRISTVNIGVNASLPRITPTIYKA